MLNIITNICHQLLFSYKDAQPYLNYISSRLSIDTINHYQFGYFPNYKDIYLLSSQINLSNLEALSLIYSKQVEDSISYRQVHHIFFEYHQLIMPYHDSYNNIIALVGRTILSEEERKNLNIIKYKNTQFNKGDHLFNLNNAIESILENDCVYIVEGQLDCAKAYEKGLYNVVAVGNSHLSDYQISILLRYTNNIILLFDSDSAGQSGIERAKTKYKNVCNLSSLSLPTGYKDLDEFFNEYSLEDFKYLK